MLRKTPTAPVRLNPDLPVGLEQVGLKPILPYEYACLAVWP